MMGDVHKINIPDLNLKKGFGWIYRLYSGGEVVYVGQTIKKHPLQRIGAHVGDKVFDSYSVEQVEVEDLTVVEMDLIREIKPKYNKTGLRKPGVYQLITTDPVVMHIAHNFDIQYTKIEAVSFVSAYLNKRGVDFGSDDRARLLKTISRKIETNDGMYWKSVLIIYCDEIIKQHV